MTRFTIRSLVAFAAVAFAALAVLQPATAQIDPQADASATTTRVSGKEFSFKLSAKSIARPGTIAFRFKNVGHIVHNFHIKGKGTPDLQPGRTAKLSVRFTHKGRYRYLCTEPGHAAAGMRGVFTVR
jgi:uncharacterized cupredoxin-like copper-binding protein